MAGNVPPQDLRELTTQICQDQQQSWASGNRYLVEYYLEQYPSLADRSDELLDLIYNEICLRYESGQTIAHSEYFARFPHLKSQLADLFEVHAAVNSEDAEAWIQAPDADDSQADHALTAVRSVKPSDATIPHVVEQASMRRRPNGNASHRRGGRSVAIGQQIGDYRLQRVIAEGGMGIVYQAYQISLARTVALKMIRSGHFASDEEISRFESEARAAAGLRHPNIVSIHEVDMVDGHRYFTMDYVDGPTLAQLIDGKPMPFRRAAGYLLTIAEAVQYAHEHHVLHRDLKPSNILFDNRDQPHVADFGVSKRFNPDFDSSNAPTLHTQAIVGTPSYMPPEQANRELGATTEASDVYSLGAILYETLTGRPPFRATTPIETMLQVLRQDPPSPRLLNPSVPRDLETICLKCLEKDPHRRYPSAAALADDLRRFLADEPITARPASWLEKAWRRCRRRPGTAVLGAIAASLALFLLIASPLVTVRERRLRQEAEERRVEAEQELRISQAHQLAVEAFADLDEHPQRALLLGIEAVNVTRSVGEPVVPVAEQFLRTALQQVGGRPLPGIQESLRLLDTDPGGRYLVAASDATDSILLWKLTNLPVTDPPQLLQGHQGEIAAIAFAPQGRELISVDWDGRLIRWKAQGETFCQSQEVTFDHPLHLARYNRDGRYLAVAGQGSDVHVWQTEQSINDEPIRLPGHGEQVTHLEFAPRGSLLATSGFDGTVRLWQLTAGKAHEIALPQREFAGAVHHVVFSSDGRYLAVTGASSDSIDAESILRLWQIPQGLNLSAASSDASKETSGPSIPAPLEMPAHTFAFTADGTRLATAGSDGLLNLWNLATMAGPQAAGPAGANIATDAQELGVFPEGIEYLEFSADGQWLLSVSSYREGRQIRVWRLYADRAFNPGNIPSSAIAIRAHFTPDSRQLIVSEYNNRVQLWTLRADRSGWTKPIELRGHDSDVEQLAFDPAGSWMATAAEDGGVRLWNLNRPLANGSWYEAASPIETVVRAASLPQSERLALVDSSHGISIFDTAAQRQLSRNPGKEEIVSIRATRNGQWLLTGDYGGRLKRWKIEPNGELAADLSTPPQSGVVLEFGASADGNYLASVDAHQRVRLWHVTDGEMRQVAIPGADVDDDSENNPGVKCVDVASNGAWLACGRSDGTVRVWSINSDQLQQPTDALRLEAEVAIVAFMYDGRWLVVAGSDGSVHLRRWPGDDDGENVIRIGEPNETIALALAPNGHRVAVATPQGRIRIWDVSEAAPPTLAFELQTTQGTLERLALSDDGSKLLIGTSEGQVRLWELSPTQRGPVQLQKDRLGLKQMGFVAGRWAYVVGWDGHFWMCNLDIDELVQIAQQLAGRSPTDNERLEWGQ